MRDGEQLVRGRYDRAIEPPNHARRTIARLALPLYLPAFLISTGAGMLIPVLPLYLRDIGLSYTLVTAVLAAVGLGSLLSQIPAGSAIERFGESRVMIASVLLIAGATMLLGVVAVTLALVVLRALDGVGSTGWLLSRQTFMTRVVPVDIRGRVMSAFGGVRRFAFLVGPLLGGYAAAQLGFETAFLLTGALTALGAVPLLRRDLRAETRRPASGRGPADRLREFVREHRRSIAAAGTVQLGVIAAREGRLAVMPLLGAAIGLDVAEVGLLVAVGAAADLLLFPAAGVLMDRFGRLAAVVPSLVLFAAGLFMAAAATSQLVLMAAGAVVGFGNGLGAGTMLTIGSDLAPVQQTSRFLSVLGTTREVGRILGPLLVGWMADSIGLPASAVALGVVALLTAALMAGVLGDTRRTALAAGWQ